MNIRTLLATTTLTIAAFTGYAQADTPDVPAKPYHYGMPIHVAKVISLEEPRSADCEVVNAKLTYLDDSGNVEAFTYFKMAQACEEQN
ncbi:DUF2790 domain-containing protein [Pseudomonas sp. SW-3]|jgi:hypothetical protein|uniref:DUF2790 domain-containing protein n=1 Tax=Pseudomonas sp. SW-3 TaxID=147212 RepID=UPI00190AC1D4|nr:DUF2790 domain-containing protein [Pseudomonas sp. SW-3]QQO01291.1 DUF2790 domain-containing protein [Pseudomonas sp. SW-3]